jgi:hypothetical protein
MKKGLRVLVLIIITVAVCIPLMAPRSGWRGGLEAPPPATTAK